MSYERIQKLEAELKAHIDALLWRAAGVDARVIVALRREGQEQRAIDIAKYRTLPRSPHACRLMPLERLTTTTISSANS